MPAYIGRDDLHFCITRERLIFLDAAADSYMCLDHAGTAAVLPLIRSGDTRLILNGDDVPTEARSVIESMVQRGLLTEGPAASPLQTDRYERGPRPARALQRFARPRAQPARFADFLYASVRAS